MVRRIVLLVLFASSVAALIGTAACGLRARTFNAAFDKLEPGDSEATVLQLFGAQPSVREAPGQPFFRYASDACKGACAARLWFENRLSLDTQAWSVEFDRDGRLIKKSRWISP
ncbi:hypothetical protein [Achromobacter sp. NCFB-sbj8-Ac1-l]|uniref:hypothetical protein n=1 Tax=unclassified Achromobacter TaxID=2626865 RepID=UPI0040469C37